MMKRYGYARMAGFPRGSGIEELEEGDYVLRSDALAALESLRERAAKMIYHEARICKDEKLEGLLLRIAYQVDGINLEEGQ